MTEPTQVPSLDEQPLEKVVRFRGRTFTVRELSIGEYDAIVKLSTDEIEIPDELSGGTQKIQRVDGARQNRLMMDKCLVKIDPPLGKGGLMALPTRLYGGLNRIIQQMHFEEEPDEFSSVPDAAGDAEKGKAKGKD